MPTSKAYIFKRPTQPAGLPKSQNLHKTSTGITASPSKKLDNFSHYVHSCKQSALNSQLCLF